MSGSRRHDNEASLACKARQGDSEALAQLLDDNWSWLKGLLYNILQDSDAVDEALQNTCLLVVDHISSLREPERFKAWLARVARNVGLAYRQKMSRRPIQLDELLAAMRPDPEAGRALERLARREEHERLLDAVKRLPEKYREVFILKHIENMSYAQIADILEITLTTVQIRLVRARRMIHNRLTGKPTDKVPRT